MSWTTLRSPTVLASLTLALLFGGCQAALDLDAPPPLTNRDFTTSNEGFILNDFGAPVGTALEGHF